MMPINTKPASEIITKPSTVDQYLQSLKTAPIDEADKLCLALPTFPTISPLFLMASGMARMPVPTLPFNKWIMVSVLDILGRVSP